ncbi:uncharacterized protein G2W53_032705 [Senna tora]|uniref:Uncharacterized protein n=1 Tax=Senna tora TaxID=362788 RepID=A0A834WC30_9FABA|nr:uncharacterized protein G2W53_032705 [Senna tora]
MRFEESVVVVAAAAGEVRRSKPPMIAFLLYIHAFLSIFFLREVTLLLSIFSERDECSALLLWLSPKNAVQAADSVNIAHKSKHRSLFSIFCVWFDLP